MVKTLPTDVTFTMSRDAGTGCLCSRCLLPIISEPPIKIIPDEGGYELRYHQRCITPNS